MGTIIREKYEENTWKITQLSLPKCPPYGEAGSLQREADSQTFWEVLDANTQGQISVDKYNFTLKKVKQCLVTFAKHFVQKCIKSFKHCAHYCLQTVWLLQSICIKRMTYVINTINRVSVIAVSVRDIGFPFCLNFAMIQTFQNKSA